jgi:glycosyltransferase involved in cell wall biosynthesis
MNNPFLNRPDGSRRRLQVAVVYPFFPHYRAPVFRELLERGENDYWLVGDTQSVEPGVTEWQPENRARFIRARCRSLGSSFMIQNELISLSLRRDLDAFVFLANPYFLSTWIAAAIARLRGKRVLFWTHGWTRTERGLKSWLRSAFYRLSHGLLLYGHQARRAGITRGFSPDRLHVVYNSLDYETHKRLRQQVTPEQVQALKQSLFENPSLPLVVCTARLTRRCRFDLLIEAQARLAKTGHAINVLLIGDGPEKAALEAQARRLGAPVKFLGACYDEETLAGWTMAAHVTASPGKVGLTAIQSLAYGTPVITHSDVETQGPEWEAIQPGHSGGFFRRDDVDDLARVLKLWTSGPAPSFAARERCWQIIERYYNPSYQRLAIELALRGEAVEQAVPFQEMPLAA